MRTGAWGAAGRPAGARPRVGPQWWFRASRRPERIEDCASDFRAGLRPRSARRCCSASHGATVSPPRGGAAPGGARGAERLLRGRRACCSTWMPLWRRSAPAAAPPSSPRARATLIRAWMIRTASREMGGRHAKPAKGARARRARSKVRRLCASAPAPGPLPRHPGANAPPLRPLRRLGVVRRRARGRGGRSRRAFPPAAVQGHGVRGCWQPGARLGVWAWGRRHC